MRGVRGKHPGDEASGMRGARALRRIGRAFLGLLVFGPGPIQGSWAGRLANEIGPEPMVPTMPPFFLPGGANAPDWKKKQA